jgi:hypothetical protein
MKTRFLLITIFVLAIKFAQAQTTSTNMVVFPGPFCGMAIIKFDLANDDTVTLKVYNRWGQAIRTYFTNAALPSGSYQINFYSDTLEPGVYLVGFIYSDTLGISRFVTKINCATGIDKVPPPVIPVVLFPNPTSGPLTISIAGLKTIVITNLNGQICKTVKTMEQTISVSELPDGEYLVSIFSEDGKLLAREKIIRVQ